MEPGLPNGAEAGAGAAPPAAPVKPEPALELGTAPGLKLDQVRNLRLYNMMFFIRYLLFISLMFESGKYSLI